MAPELSIMSITNVLPSVHDVPELVLKFVTDEVNVLRFYGVISDVQT